jgi:hypothetical protein
MDENWEHRHLSDVPQADDCVPDMVQSARLDFLVVVISILTLIRANG